MSKNILLNIIVILVILAGSFYSYRVVVNNNSTPLTDTTFISDTVYNTDTVTIIEYVPKYEVIVDTAWKILPIDTNAILADYHNKIVMEDTVCNDSTLLVIIKDTIYRNRIQHRSADIFKTFPTISSTKTLTIHEPQNGIYAGIYAGKGSGAQIAYKYNRYVFAVGYGTDGPTLSLLYKINNK